LSLRFIEEELWTAAALLPLFSFLAPALPQSIKAAPHEIGELCSELCQLVSLLEATLTRLSASADSKPFTETLTHLESTLTKNRGQAQR
jgi:hypothetical protein